MINTKIKKLIEREKKKGEFIFPFYEKYCFSNIPSTILSFFGIKSKKPLLPSEVYESVLKERKPLKIILLLIDGFGFNSWLKHSENYEFFNIFNQKGLVSPLTSMFPSTTASALTTINSGLTTQEHALHEWFVYFKEIDKIIATLPFTAVDEEGRDKLLKQGVNPQILFRGKTIYQILEKSGVKTFTFNNKVYNNSAYSELVHKGSTAIPFRKSSDLMVSLRKKLIEEKGPAYFYIYWDNLDSIAHRYGPDSEEYQAELNNISCIFTEELFGKIKSSIAKETIFIITADHGEVKVFPEKTIFLNRYRGLKDNFQKGKNGKPILPTGAPRDVFLHIKPEKLEEAFKFLRQELKNKAEILKINEAVKMGLFGIGKPRKEFLDRVGNLLILPYKDYTVWYKYPNTELPKFLGHHGGLSEEEMLIPFAIARFSDLL